MQLCAEILLVCGEFYILSPKSSLNTLHYLDTIWLINNISDNLLKITNTRELQSRTTKIYMNAGPQENQMYKWLLRWRQCIIFYQEVDHKSPCLGHSIKSFNFMFMARYKSFDPSGFYGWWKHVPNKSTCRKMNWLFYSFSSPSAVSPVSMHHSTEFHHLLDFGLTSESTIALT